MLNPNFNKAKAAYIPKNNERDLHDAILTDNADLLIDLICEKQVPINAFRFTEYKETLLLRAVNEEKINCVRVLLINGADPQLVDWCNYSSLDLAVVGGYVNIVKAILETNAKLPNDMLDLALILAKKPRYFNDQILNELENYKKQANQPKIVQQAPMQPSHTNKPMTQQNNNAVIINKPITQQYNNVVKSAQTVVTNKVEEKKSEPENEIPEAYLCKISDELMNDPVTTPNGVSYDREQIIAWINKAGTDPLTGEKLTIADLRDNKALKELIDGYKKNLQAKTAPEKKIRQLPEIPKF